MRSSLSVFLMGLAACVMFALPLAAQPKPDFTGVWKMNAAESRATGDGPFSLTLRVDHKEPVLKYKATGADSEGEDFEEQGEFTTDGKEHPGPATSTIVVHWDGQNLIVEFSQGKSIVQTISMRLSEDGKRLIRNVVLKDEGGENRMHQVFEKQ